MNDFWAQRTAGEKRMLVLCAIVLVVAVPLLLMPPGGSKKALLPAPVARQQYEEKLKQKETLDAEMTQVQPKIGHAVYTEPPEQLVPKVVRTLQGYAKDSGIHLREIKPLRTRKLGDLTKETMSVRFTSDFGKTVPFFYRVDDPAGKLIIEKFNVTAADPKSRSVDVEAQVALYTTAAPADSGKTGGPA